MIGGESKPWLQKIMTLIAISLKIAKVDTFNVANYQYQDKYSYLGYAKRLKLINKLLNHKNMFTSQII